MSIARQDANGAGKLAVHESMFEQVDRFVRAEKMALQLTRSGDGEVTIRPSDKRRGCDPATLWCGGWITCTRAHEIARRLGIEPIRLGTLLDFLDIKVRHCELGCFS